LLASESLKKTLQLGADNINIDRQILVQIGKYNINIGKGEIDDSAFTRKAIDVSAVILIVIIDLTVNFNMILPFSLPIEIGGKNSNFLE
jgi:hypothetical protein